MEKKLIYRKKSSWTGKNLLPYGKNLLTSLLLLGMIGEGCDSNAIPHTEKRFCVEVEEVRYRKKGSTSIIRPRCQKKGSREKMPWYRYPTKNIHRGDTVDISEKDLIGPRF